MYRNNQSQRAGKSQRKRKMLNRITERKRVRRNRSLTVVIMLG